MKCGNQITTSRSSWHCKEHWGKTKSFLFPLDCNCLFSQKEKLNLGMIMPQLCELGCWKSQHSLQCILCSFYSSDCLVFPLALENTGRMLKIRLEFSSQCRHVQGLVWTPGWVVSLRVHLACTQEPFSEKFFNLCCSDKLEIVYSFLEWPALSMRSQSFEKQEVSSQYLCNMPKVHEANPPSGSLSGFGGLWQAQKTTQQFTISVCVKHRKKLSKAAVTALTVCWCCLYMASRKVPLSSQGKTRLPSLVLYTPRVFPVHTIHVAKRIFLCWLK